MLLEAFSYSTFDLGTIDKGSREVAFKVHKLRVSSCTRKKDLNRIYEEIRHDAKLMHRIPPGENVVHIFGLTFYGNNPVIIVERGQDDLERYLDDAKEYGNPVSWIEKVSFCIDIVAGVKALHKSGVVHGDLKARNVIVFVADDGSKTAKIADFGFSYANSSNGKHEGGTLNCRAPECTAITSQFPELIGLNRKPEQDIYGIGIVVRQIAMDGGLDSENQTRNIPDDTPDGLQSVITRAKEFFPKDRASIDEIQCILVMTRVVLEQGRH